MTPLRSRPTFRAMLGGKAFPDWTAWRLTRSLTDISGSFELEYDDALRLQAAIPQAVERHDMPTITEYMEARIYLDDELVLVGRVDEVDWEVTGDRVQARLTGRDLTGQLVDCSAAPEGPVEFKGLTALEIITRICKPYGIKVTAEVDVGAPLPDYGLDVGEKAMSAIDKAAKQRALLVTSDGVGGLVLTRSGGRRAPAPLALPGNVVSMGARVSGRERFSDYWVKGQYRQQRAGKRKAALDGTAHPLTSRPAEGSATSSHSRRPVSTAGLDGTAFPLSAGSGAGAPAASQKARQSAAIVSTGHAVDPDVKRILYRPIVFSTRAQSGGAPNQVLAEWRMRIARGKAIKHRYTVRDWRAGGDGRLWRPNELVEIAIGKQSPYDMLVESVVYAQSDKDGSATQMHVVGREAYDLEPLPDQHRRHGRHAGVAKGSNVADTRSRPEPGERHR